jgi:GNAT superfamily N-acetyltransferase
MEFKTIDYWDPALWEMAEPVFHQAFPEHGRKRKTIIRGMFEKKMCQLHAAFDRSELIAMALTGKLVNLNALLIDYLAVRQDRRNQGIGRMFLEHIKGWAVAEGHYDGIIIEIESEATPTNVKRSHFWRECGFNLTDYVHTYIWVPEPYQAMYLNLHPHIKMPQDGEALFRAITQFHNKAYRAK